jgi:hypothetical protein
VLQLRGALAVDVRFEGCSAGLSRSALPDRLHSDLYQLLAYSTALALPEGHLGRRSQLLRCARSRHSLWSAGSYDMALFEAHVIDERIVGARDGYPWLQGVGGVLCRVVISRQGRKSDATIVIFGKSAPSGCMGSVM